MRKRHWRRSVDGAVHGEGSVHLPGVGSPWALGDEGGYGTKVVTRYVIRKLMEPVTEAIWIAPEEETMDALLGRRRMREKVSPVFKKMMSEEGEEAEERRAEDPVLIQRIIEEEMVNLIHDDPESTRGELKLLGGLKKMIEEKKESEEILQTKIVSPYEVQRNWEEWKDAAAEEIRSLLEEKEALEKMTKTELEEMKRQVQRDGKNRRWYSPRSRARRVGSQRSAGWFVGTSRRREEKKTRSHQVQIQLP